MNTLSWLIYAAEVSGNLSTLAGAGAVVGAMAIGAVSLISAIGASDGDMPEGSWKRPLKYLWLVAVIAIVAAALPSSRAIYMIAASEAGETIVTSPDAIEMMGDLKAIIKKRLKDELSAE